MPRKPASSRQILLMLAVAGASCALAVAAWVIGVPGSKQPPTMEALRVQIDRGVKSGSSRQEVPQDPSQQALVTLPDASWPELAAVFGEIIEKPAPVVEEEVVVVVDETTDTAPSQPPTPEDTKPPNWQYVGYVSMPDSAAAVITINGRQAVWRLGEEVRDPGWPEEVFGVVIEVSDRHLRVDRTDEFFLVERPVQVSAGDESGRGRNAANRVPEGNVNLTPSRNDSEMTDRERMLEERRRARSERIQRGGA